MVVLRILRTFGSGQDVRHSRLGDGKCMSGIDGRLGDGGRLWEARGVCGEERMERLIKRTP